MLKGNLALGLVIMLSGCSSMPMAETTPEQNQVYSAECVSAGHKTGTQAYLECIRQTGKMAQAREQYNQQKQGMIDQVRGRDFHKMNRVHVLP